MTCFQMKYFQLNSPRPDFFGFQEHLRDLAFKDLGMEHYEVEKHLQTNRNEVTSAAYSLEWRNTQESKTIAFTNIRTALGRADMCLIVNELQQTSH